MTRTYDSWKTTDPRDMEPEDYSGHSHRGRAERDPDDAYDEWRDEQLQKDERKIRTSHVYPPIPIRTFDWSACYDGHEERGPYGYGRTEAEAIKDLIEQTEYDDE